MAVPKIRGKGTSDVNRKSILYGCLSLAAIAVHAWLLGVSPEFKAFSMGIGIFSVNLWLWIIVVRELLNSAADSAESLRDYLQERRSSHLTETFVADSHGENDPANSTSESGKADHNKGRKNLMILGMGLKLVLLGGGFYVCLAVFKFQPIYFVAGFGTGLAFFAVASYGIRD